MATNYISVDLGTYNLSAATRSEKGAIEVLKDLSDRLNIRIGSKNQIEKLKEFPSFISFNTDDSIRDIAINGKERAYTEPEYVVWWIKRLLGKTFTELKESGELERFPYRIRPNRKNGQCLVYIGDKSYTPEHLCAEIFKKIRSEAERQEKKEF